MQPDNERGRPCQDAPEVLAAKLATCDQSTAPILAVDGSGVVAMDAELRTPWGGAR